MDMAAVKVVFANFGVNGSAGKTTTMDVYDGMTYTEVLERIQMAMYFCHPGDYANFMQNKQNVTWFLLGPEEATTIQRGLTPADLDKGGVACNGISVYKR